VLRRGESWWPAHPGGVDLSQPKDTHAASSATEPGLPVLAFRSRRAPRNPRYAGPRAGPLIAADNLRFEGNPIAESPTTLWDNLALQCVWRSCPPIRRPTTRCVVRALPPSNEITPRRRLTFSHPGPSAHACTTSVRTGPSWKAWSGSTTSSLAASPSHRMRQPAPSTEFGVKHVFAVERLSVVRCRVAIGQPQRRFGK
jgi:hypothetical protein